MPSTYIGPVSKGIFSPQIGISYGVRQPLMLHQPDNHGTLRFYADVPPFERIYRLPRKKLKRDKKEFAARIGVPAKLVTYSKITSIMKFNHDKFERYLKKQSLSKNIEIFKKLIEYGKTT